MNDKNSNANNNNNENSWLGFSLSPHMKMEVSSPSSSTTAAMAAQSFHLSPSLCYGVGEASAFHFPLPVMPLKSDGSLCIMQPLSRSHPNGMVPNGSPKLEDFLGGATMGENHQFGSHEREAMALSLDSIYYHNPNDPQEAARHRGSLDFLQEPQTPHSYFSTLQCHDLYQEPLDGENELKNWVSVGPFSGGGGGGQQPFDHHPTTTTMVGEGGGGMGCNELQSLSLSMSPGSQSSCVTAARQISPTELECCVAMESKKRASMKVVPKQPVHRKSIDTFGQRTSQYRGVTRHRWTGRYEAHLWDNSCKKEGQTRKGRQVYLGGYDMEEKAARAYDLAALKYWGPSTHINFPLENYQKELEEMKNMTRQEYVAHLRRKSSGFSRGASIYRGVTRHHQHGRWQARIGRVAGNKDLYLGTFSTQEEAAEAYDIAAIKFRGVNAVTNFDISRYDVDKIIASNTLPTGEVARRNKEIREPPVEAAAIEYNNIAPPEGGECVQDGRATANASDWNMMLYSSPQQQNSVSLEALQEKALSIGGGGFSVALHDVFGNETSQGVLQQQDESNKMDSHISNPSSLVTSLGSSREASPDKTGASMVFTAKTKFLIPAGNVAAASMPHLPVYAAWNDT
ncbi:AP2-like ethylene-responsive transcription factor ANT [Ipomoea triloba]|uniref:AP2-like ethylene-responsive transcription factor ANT n=1 Tax=Ipomoea triloba TaxID=35885 RepID=UPI00125D95B7|nr:AP2-like ethylene-responsive transcription factor ANT [Ipomoea triloba]